MLTVLSVSYPFAPVGRDTTGGAEQVLAQLDHALAARGDRSLVVASKGSQIAGTLLATPPFEETIDDAARASAHDVHRRAIASAMQRWPVDLIHMHGIDFGAYLPPPGPPVLVTLHLPLAWYDPQALRPSRANTFLHCVSATQRAQAPPDLALLPDVPNGVDAEALERGLAKRGYVAALGRICPEKGFHLALDAAKAAGVPMLLAGAVFPYTAHQTYFAQEIAPRLDRRRRFVGPLSFIPKRRLLGGARCLLVPSLAPETSSLVAMEALACGTPVIAFPNGALADLIDQGVTGFLVRDTDEMAEAITAADTLDPSNCQAAARERFPAERTVKRYLELYSELVSTRRQVA